MGDSMIKGNALEKAVEAIEKAILLQSPGLSEKTFSIERKKIQTVDGVRHEIDIWVDIDHGHDYHSLFIFECKNRKTKVNKNDVIVLSAKIDAVLAQKGFLVGTSFTRSACAQAKKDMRIQLIESRDLLESKTAAPLEFSLSWVQKASFSADVVVRGNPTDMPCGEIPSPNVFVFGSAVDFATYIDTWEDEIQERVSTNEQDEECRELSVSETRNFEPGQFIWNGHDVAYIKVSGVWTQHNVKPTIISRFDFATRGRVYSFAPIHLENGEIWSWEYVELPEKQNQFLMTVHGPPNTKFRMRSRKS